MNGARVEGAAMPGLREVALWSGAVLGAILLHGAAALVLRDMQATPEPPAALEQAFEVEFAPIQMSTPEAVASEELAAVQPTETLAPVDEAEADEPSPVDAQGEAAPEQADPVQPEEAPETPAPDVLAPAEAAEPLRAEPVEPVRPTPEATETRTASPVEPAPPWPREPSTPASEDPAAEAAKPQPDAVEPVLPTPADMVEAQEVVETELASLPDTVAVLPQARPVPSRPAEAQSEDEPQREARERQDKAEKRQARQIAADANEGANRRPAESPKRKNSAAASRRAEAGEPSRSEASAESRAAKAPSVNPAKWQAKVLARLNRFKRYPRGARDEGTVTISFRVSASGAVSGATVTRSSGAPELDEAAIAMVRKASPVPAPPETVGATTITVPVRFSR